MVAVRNANYDGDMLIAIPNKEYQIMRHLPLTWAALHVALASAATLLLCSTDVLHGPVASMLIH